jgi:hypothetical protein
VPVAGQSTALVVRPGIVTSADPEKDTANICVFLERNDNTPTELLPQSFGHQLMLVEVHGDHGPTPMPLTWHWPPRT